MRLLQFVIVISITVITHNGSLLANKKINNNNTPLLMEGNTGMVLFHRKGWEQSFPAYDLNSGDVLILNFDLLESDFKNLKYKILQKDVAWSQTNSQFHEYLDGFQEQNIDRMEHSLNTTVDYINYQLQIPNDHLKILQSGNYEVVVYEESEENPILRKRFVVYEQEVKISGEADSFHKSLSSEIQKMNVNVDFGNLYVSNPHNELIFSHMINGDWNTLTQRDDYRMNGNSQVVFRDDKAIEFQGGNEYRYFDNRSIKLTSERVETIDYQQPWFHHYLKPDEFKNFKNYLFSKDLNGWFIINENSNWNDKHTEADYTWVHFRLNCQQPYLSRMYVYGALSNWQCNEHSELMYDIDRRAYTGKLLLKQGFYNYRYIMKAVDEEIDWSLVEGSHSETENNLMVFVYYKEPGYDFERLMGFEIINSTN